MIVVVGAGIAGVACARALVDAGRQVQVLDRGRRIGGRLARRSVTAWDNGGAATGEPHVVDVGASYLTVTDPRFATVVRDWVDRGLARTWSDRFHVRDATGWHGPKVGPMRYGTADGLRSLVEDLAIGLDVAHPCDVSAVRARSAPAAGSVVPAAGSVPAASEASDSGGWLVDVVGGPSIEADAVVVAAPDPQAARIMPPAIAEGMYPAGPWPWDPVVAVAAAWPTRWWDDDAGFDGVFVNDDPVITWIADDGRRRGDGAPVLVAHSTPAAAAAWLSDPEQALEPVVAAIGRAFGRAVPPFIWSHVQRWGLSQSRRERPAPPYLLHPSLLGVCGDAWGERSSVEGAWLSGTRLGAELARLLV